MVGVSFVDERLRGRDGYAYASAIFAGSEGSTARESIVVEAKTPR